VSLLVLLRHGESTWNRENLFTGWVDVDLSDRGEKEARQAGRLLREAALEPGVVHSSVQRRAIRTAVLAMEEMDLLWLPLRCHWRLNERHYGALQGKDKRRTAAEFGAEQVRLWRRSYDVPPPPVGLDDPMHPRHDPRYRDLAPDVLPASECLKDVVARVLPYWHDAVVPDLRAGRRVLIAAHGNSLRGLVKHLEGISDDDIADLNLPTGNPLVYRLDDDLGPEGRPGLMGLRGRYLDEDAARAGAEAVAHQADEPPQA